MRRTAQLSVFAVALALLLILGVQSHAIGQQKQITFGYLVADQLHSPAVMVMKMRKMLEAEGLKVKWQEFLAGAYLAQHFASGEVDFASTGAVPFMISRGQGVDAVVLAGCNAEGSSLVVKNSIKTLKDLDGKKIGTPGIGGIQDALLDMVAKKANVKVQHKYMKVSDMPLFFEKGEIDGYIAWAPHPDRVVASGNAHRLIVSHDILPDHQCCVLIARGDLLVKDPETVKKVVKTYLKAYEWFMEHPKETIAMISEVTGIKENVIRMAEETVKYPFPPYCNLPSMKLMATGLVESGKIPQGAIANLDEFIKQLYHPEFMEEFLQKK